MIYLYLIQGKFLQPEFLLAASAIFVLLLFYMRLMFWKKSVKKKMGDEQLVAAMMPNYSSKKFLLKFILTCSAFLLIVLSLSNWATKGKTENVKRKGVDIMIALDVSKSMLADDIKPSRLERAKQIVSKLIDLEEDNRIGIILFAGRAYIQMPLTTDFEAAKMYINNAAPDVLPSQGTVIADALRLAINSFDANDKKYKTVILISDGEDHDNEATKVAADLVNNGIVIHTIGIGSPEGSFLMNENKTDYKKDDQGNNIISKLNEKLLKEIAQKGNGIYQLFDNSTDVADVIKNELAKMDSKKMDETIFSNYTSWYWIFLLPATFLLGGEYFISEIKKLKR